METWKMELTAEGQILSEVQIQRDIFQGDGLLQVMFVVTIMLFSYVLGKSQSAKDPQNSRKDKTPYVYRW